MTNKEVLAELRKSYIYMEDLINNAEITDEAKKDLKKVCKIIEKTYYDVYRELDLEEVEIVYKKEFIGVICEDVWYDYMAYNEEEEEEYYTCADIGYYWYEDKDFLEE